MPRRLGGGEGRKRRDQPVIVSERPFPRITSARLIYPLQLARPAATEAPSTRHTRVRITGTQSVVPTSSPSLYTAASFGTLSAEDFCLPRMSRRRQLFRVGLLSGPCLVPSAPCAREDPFASPLQTRRRGETRRQASRSLFPVRAMISRSALPSGQQRSSLCAYAQPIPPTTCDHFSEVDRTSGTFACPARKTSSAGAST